MFASQCLDFAILVNGAVYHLKRDGRCIQHGERLHDDDIHQSVAQRGFGRNVEIVAVLRGIGASDEEGFVLHATIFVFNLIGLGFVSKSFAQSVFNVGGNAPLAGLCKLHADECIKPYTTGTEEGYVIDFPIINVLNVALVDDFNGLLDVHRYLQMTGQSVARAAWDNAKCR